MMLNEHLDLQNKQCLYNFLDLLKDMFNRDDLAIVLCADKNTKKDKLVLCAIMNNNESGTSSIVPLAQLFNNDPYDRLEPLQVLACQADLESDVVFNNSPTANIDPPESSRPFNIQRLN